MNLTSVKTVLIWVKELVMFLLLMTLIGHVSLTGYAVMGSHETGLIWKIFSNDWTAWLIMTEAIIGVVSVVFPLPIIFGIGGWVNYLTGSSTAALVSCAITFIAWSICIKISEK